MAFIVVFATFQLTWQSLSGTAVEAFVIHTCTVLPAAALVNVLTPAIQARAVGHSLHAPGGGLNILNGCEGLDVLFLLISAFIAAPIPWSARLAGLAIGVPLIFLLNQARILALFYAYRASHPLFDTLHAMVTPIALIVVVMGYFYAWLVYCGRRASVPA